MTTTEIIEEGFREGHIAIPQGSEWLRSKLISYRNSIIEEAMKVARTHLMGGEPTIDDWRAFVEDVTNIEALKSK